MDKTRRCLRKMRWPDGAAGNAARRFFVFANEHHRATYCTAIPAESPNDRNDRAIRAATAWCGCPPARQLYSQLLLCEQRDPVLPEVPLHPLVVRYAKVVPNVRILLLTNDAANRAIAKQEGLNVRAKMPLKNSFPRRGGLPRRGPLALTADPPVFLLRACP